MIAVLRRNLAYKLVSVAIAILLYSIANNSANNRLSNYVTVLPQPIGLPDDLVVRGSISSFTVSVAGPSAAVRSFRDETLKATLDLSHVKPGLNKVPIEYKLPSSDIDTSNWPATRDIFVEHKSTHEYTVDAQFDNEPPPGYAYGDAESMPARVKVSGLQADVQRVGRILAVVPRAPGSFNIDQPVDLIAQDENQQTIDSVEMDPPKVRVRVPLRRALATKSLLLSPELVGMPAPGFAVSNCTFRPLSLTVSGTEETLRLLTNISVPVHIDGLKSASVQNVHVPLPAGVSAPTPGDVTAEVEVHVAPISTLVTASPTPGPLVSAATPVPAAIATPTPTSPAPHPSAP